MKVKPNTKAVRKYRAKNREKLNARSKAYYADNVSMFRKWQRIRLYPAPTRREPRKCEICKRRMINALCLDHDHKTGKFRGWICQQCNSGIALLGDNIKGVSAALKYLKGELSSAS